MIYKCVAMTAQLDDSNTTYYDFEFEGLDGSRLLVAEITQVAYDIGGTYTLSLSPTTAYTETK